MIWGSWPLISGWSNTLSYQVIARKWRPKTFAELVGQNHVAQTLLNGLKSGRLAHALLLTGPRGTGKTSTARILAKSVRCPNAVDFVPCNQCAECEDIAQGRSMNVMEIDGASHNGVDAIRELRDTIGYMPSTGRFKIYIIDEVHMLSTSAFNALLKTLEEPPEHVLFVLATTEIQKIPNTILSRCQRMDFRRISAREVVERLRKICEDEGVSVDNESLWLIARQSEGSMRDSQSLLDQVITYCDRQVTASKTADALGLSDRALLLDTLRMLVARDEAGTVNLVERIHLSGIDAKVFVQDLLQEIRHLLLVKMGLGSANQLLDLPDAEIKLLSELAASLSQEDIHLLFDMALKGATEIPRSHDPQLVLEMLLFRMSAAPRIESLMSTSPVQTPTAAKVPAFAKASAGPSAPSQTEKKTPESPLVLAKTESIRTEPFIEKPQTLDEKWFAFVNEVNGFSAFLGAKLSHARALDADNTKKTLKVGISQSHKFLFDQLNTPANRKQIDELLDKHWQPQFKIEFLLADANVETKSPQALAEEMRQQKQKSARDQVENHPVIQNIQKVFKSEIRTIKESP